MGKLSLYTALGGIRPSAVSVLDLVLLIEQKFVLYTISFAIAIAIIWCIRIYAVTC